MFLKGEFISFVNASTSRTISTSQESTVVLIFESFREIESHRCCRVPSCLLRALGLTVWDWDLLEKVGLEAYRGGG
jgi:hypothetical protein